MQTRRDSPRGTLSSIFVSVILCLSTNAQIENSGFENDWDGWNRTDPSAISSDAHSGSKAAKITGPGGRLEQSVSLEADSKYELSAWVEGAGVIGIEGGPSTKTSGDGYRKYVVPFTTDNSGPTQLTQHAPQQQPCNYHLAEA